MQRDKKPTAQRFRNENEERRDKILQTIQNNNPQPQTEEDERVSILTQSENNQSFLNEELICQYEENIEVYVYPHEEKRKFGEPGNIFKACAICGALRMKKLKVISMKQEKIKRYFC